jgi:hypothetical protein
MATVLEPIRVLLVEDDEEDYVVTRARAIYWPDRCRAPTPN